MRRIVVLFATIALASLLVGGLALAAPKKGKNSPPASPLVIDCSLVGSGSCQGTAGDDVIYGTNSADVIIPYAGNDIVYAYGGNDEVRHSFGNDYIEGGPGADTLRGGFDSDRIFGNTPRANGVGDTADGVRDLIDCAYIASRKDQGQDLGYGGDSSDVVVDCSNRDDQ